MIQAKKYDLIVVGTGILGTFHAYHAANKGLKVLLLEKSDEARGATVQNFGQVVPSGLDSEWQRYGRTSLAIYKELTKRWNLEVQETGSYYIASNEEEMTLIKELSARNKEAGYGSELLEKATLTKRLPNLKSSYVKGGLFFPEELSVNPRQLIHQIHRGLQAEGLVDIKFNSFVIKLSTQFDSTSLYLSNGKTYNTRKVIICNGNDFRSLYPNIFMQSDLQTVKLQMLRLVKQDVVMKGNILTGLSIRRYESFKECPSYNKIKAEGPLDQELADWGIHILFKQEKDGSIILGDSHEYLDASQSSQFEDSLQTRPNELFVREGKKIMSDLQWEIEASWAGYYSQCKQDKIFNKEIEPNIHVVTGIGGKGMTASAGYALENINRIYHD